MAQCRAVKEGFEQSIQRPIEHWFDQAVRECNEVPRRVEETIERPVERWETQTRRDCDGWGFFAFLCHFVTAVIAVIVMIVITVVKWVVYIVCAVVMRVIRFIVQIIVRVIKWIVVFFGCLFTNPGDFFSGFLGLLLDLWTSLLGAVEDLFRGIVDLARTVIVGLLDDIAGFLTTFLSRFGVVGDVIAGIINGLISVISDFFDAALDYVDGALELIFGIYTLDINKIVAGVTHLLLGVAKLIAVVIRAWTFGWLAGGIRESFDNRGVRDCVSRLIEQEISDPGRAARIRSAVGVDVGKVDLDWPLTVTRLFLDSRSTSLDLATLHRDGTIDLYQAVGAFDFGVNFRHPRFEAVLADTSQPVTRADIDLYLSADRAQAPHFRIFAIKNDLLNQHLRLAGRKAKQLGLNFRWTVTDQEATDRVDLTVTDDSVTLDRFLGQTLHRSGSVSEVCTLALGATFRGVDLASGGQLNGVARTFNPMSQPFLCGVAYRERLPDNIFRYVLIHEIGHYFGLEHAGHDGFHNIMYTMETDPTTGMAMPPVTAATVGETLWLSGEPRFTLDDRCAVWRWILHNANDCISP